MPENKLFELVSTIEKLYYRLMMEYTNEVKRGKDRFADRA